MFCFLLILAIITGSTRTSASTSVSPSEGETPRPSPRSPLVFLLTMKECYGDVMRYVCWVGLEIYTRRRRQCQCSGGARRGVSQRSEGRTAVPWTVRSKEALDLSRERRHLRCVPRVCLRRVCSVVFTAPLPCFVFLFSLVCGSKLVCISIS